MNFFTPEFFGFFLLIIFFYYIFDAKYQKYIIFLASSIFIGSLSVYYLTYTYIFIVVIYLFGHLLTYSSREKHIKNIIFNISMIIVIGALVFFKYINFILKSIFQFLHLLNFDTPLIVINIIIPLGISFYTFQAISYLLQIYRGNEVLEKDFIVFANYFLFFPKFLSGPIEQSRHFIPQLKKTIHFSYENFVTGMRLILWGAFKKLVVADRLAMIIDGVYPSLNQYSGNPLLFTFLLQPLYIYCDFSGYTDIAIGMGKIFGLTLTENFRQPLFAKSVSEFWRRWHMSLTNWCNEYIFRRIIFKKKKWGIWASVFGVFITFLVIGIWHGARWNFILLGLLQGIAINYEFFTKKFRTRVASKLSQRTVNISSIILTYLFFAFTLIFFNAENTSDVGYFLTHMFKNLDFSELNLVFLSRTDKIIVFIAIILILYIDLLQERGQVFTEILRPWPRWFRWGFYYSIIFTLAYFGSPIKEFVYMQF